ncbi:DUF1254 domain-containing protein [Actinomadura sp. HBU206391]|uniref:DUF1254 domain-containing protein n=1 Tax=Actinomadura sp. HBU206391 TaxID=2731692 RepID=UPI00164FDCAE|nr:DUF1254 domain-containing protein [Actinomadura sp. HBU206391]MBC6461671.1 DUF1254 domain-containing protein [Actinomadura sp. HBU206391]
MVAWRELLDTLAEAGGMVTSLADGVPAIDVAEGFGHILNVLTGQFDRAALRQSRHPVFLPGITPVRKFFFDNPDTDYDIAVLGGGSRYRIYGNRGSCTYLSFCVYSGMARDATTRLVNLSDRDIHFSPGGDFEVILSPVEVPGDWLRIDAGSRAVIARQYFLDRQAEVPAEYRIEVLDETTSDPPLDDLGFARAVRTTATFVKAATSLAAQRVEALRATPNRFVETGEHGPYRTPDNDYLACWYRLDEDEALLIDVQPPECRYWGVHLANRWGQSLDHRTRRTALNGRTAMPDANGTVRVVVSGTDHGLPNWLDTAGHPEGWVLFRWLLADETVVPHVEQIKLTSRRQGQGAASRTGSAE